MTDETKIAVKPPSSHVRFDSEEFSQISEDARVTGESIPALLKNSYFKGRKPHVLLPAEERNAWFRELRQWGNNLNQLARRVNAGLMEGWHAEFTEIAKRISMIEACVVSVYGRR